MALAYCGIIQIKMFEDACRAIVALNLSGIGNMQVFEQLSADAGCCCRASINLLTRCAPASCLLVHGRVARRSSCSTTQRESKMQRSMREGENT